MDDAKDIAPGRPSKYEPKFCKQAEKLCLMGATDKDLAEFFEVSKDTITEWKNKHVKFREAIKKGKMMPDANVAASLYKRAIGFETIEVTYEKSEESEDVVPGVVTQEEFKVRVVKKKVPGDVNAQKYWLNNRQRDKWGDRIEVTNPPTDADVVQEKLEGLLADPEKLKQIRQKHNNQF